MRTTYGLTRAAALLAIAASIIVPPNIHAAELRATANDRPVSRTVQVSGNAGTAPKSAKATSAGTAKTATAQNGKAASSSSNKQSTSGVGLASYIEPTSPRTASHRTVARRQEQPMPPATTPAPGGSVMRQPTRQPAAPQGRSMPSEQVWDEAVVSEHDVWAPGYGTTCGSSCGNACGSTCGGGWTGGCGSCGYGCGANMCNTWFNAEMLVWWRSERNLPTLVTGGQNLNNLNTLLGGRIDSDAEVGGRIELGYWLDPAHCTGVGIRYWQLGSEELNFNASTDDFPVIARPFLNVSGVPTFQDVQVVGNTGGAPATTGSVSVTGSSDALGGDVYLRRRLGERCGTRFEYLVGYQMARIDEDLTIRTVTNPNNFTLQDMFDARNEFHGISLGMMSHTQYGCWTFDVMTKFGLGNMEQTVIIDGSQSTGNTDIGLLARSTNIGTFTRDRFAVSPEFNFTAARAISSCAELTIGYSAIIWTGVVQPGRQIDPDLAVDTNVPPNLDRPMFQFNDNAYVLHGLTFGLRCRY